MAAGGESGAGVIPVEPASGIGRISVPRRDRSAWIDRLYRLRTELRRTDGDSADVVFALLTMLAVDAGRLAGTSTVERAGSPLLSQLAAFVTANINRPIGLRDVADALAQFLQQPLFLDHFLTVKLEPYQEFARQGAKVVVNDLGAELDGTGSSTGPAGEVTMRADNHQLVQPLYISTYVKVDGKEVKNDVERTGNGFKTDRRIEAKDTVQPTTCKMTRP